MRKQKNSLKKRHMNEITLAQRKFVYTYISRCFNSDEQNNDFFLRSSN